MKKGTMIINCVKYSRQGNGYPGFNDCIIYKNIWEQRRWGATKNTVKGVLSNEDLTTRIEEGSEYMFEGVTKEVVLLADTLVKEFQKSQSNKYHE